jgi:hypothetical protein
MSNLLLKDEHSRYHKGRFLAAHAKLRWLSDDCVEIESESKPGSFHVVWLSQDAGLHCSCKDAEVHPVQLCKHQWAFLLLSIQAVVRIEEEEEVTL